MAAGQLARDVGAGRADGGSDDDVRALGEPLGQHGQGGTVGSRQSRIVEEVAHPDEERRGRKGGGSRRARGG